MKIEMSLRIKIFLVAVLFIVLGQAVYSRSNVATFQQSYITSLREKSAKVGAILKSEVEYILNLKIPLTKLLKMENTLQEVLATAGELEFIEITDASGNALYFADHQTIGRYEPFTRQSLLRQESEVARIHDLGLSPELTDTSLPVFCRGDDAPVGFINLRLSAGLILSKSREILLDMITAILTSLLITFEFLTFFAAYSISDPIVEVTRGMHTAVSSSSLLPVRNYVFLPELSQLTTRFNQVWKNCLAQAASLTLTGARLRDAQSDLETALSGKPHDLQEILPSNRSDARASLAARLNPMLQQLRSGLTALSQHFKISSDHISLPQDLSATPMPPAPARNDAETREHALPYAYIRPVVFLFLIADGFSTSFLPLYVNSLYQPILGLSREVTVGLPISFYMLFFALSMPLCGSWSDAIGWWKPMVLGISLNALGLFLTAAATNIPQLLVFRCLTAAGFGMVFIACQQFVMDNTRTSNRTAGMASFLAAFFSGDLCGTVIGGMLADRIGYRAVFGLGGMVSLLSLAYVIALFRKEPAKTRPREVSTPFPLKHLFHVLRDREFFTVVFLQGIPAKIALIGFLFYFVPLYLKGLGTLQSSIARILMCYGVTTVFLSPVLSGLLKKAAYQRQFIALGGLLTSFAMISFEFHSGFGSILCLVIALGVAHTFSIPAQAAFIVETKIVKTLGTGTGMGLFRFWERVGNITGPLLLGYLMAWAGYERAVVILGIATLVCTVIYLLTMAFDRRLSESTATGQVDSPP